MLVLIFEASSPPTSVTYVLRHIVINNPDHADVATKILNNSYVDNYLDSFDSVEEGITICRRLRELLFLRGFVLGELATSSREFLQSLPPSERANPDLNVDLDGLPIHRTMGLQWSGESDGFFFDPIIYKATTKRGVLSAVPSIFDPMGVIASVAITGLSLRVKKS
jgi:hypothetical protein